MPCSRSTAVRAAAKSCHTRLGVLRFLQYARRVGKADFFQIKIHRCGSFVKGGAEGRKGFIKVLAHTGMLTALPSV